MRRRLVGASREVIITYHAIPPSVVRTALHVLVGRISLVKGHETVFADPTFCVFLVVRASGSLARGGVRVLLTPWLAGLCTPGACRR